LNELPFEVYWSARISGGNPPYIVESPSGMISLMSAGNVSGTELFNTNKHPLEVSIRVRDAQGLTTTARSVADSRILSGSALLFNGPRLANDSVKFHWEHVHNPDRYGGWEYVTGNEATIDSPLSPTTIVKFQWPGLYRFYLRAARPDRTEALHTIDVLVSLSKSSFGLRGAALPLLNEGQFLEWNLDRIHAWGGNLAAFHFHLYVPHPNADTIVPSWELPQVQYYRPATPRDEQLVSWIRMAHERGLSVLIVPHVVYIGRTSGIYYNRTTWVEAWQMKPENITEWFRSYTTLMLHYALIAEQTGVEIISLGADLGAHQYVPYVWRRMISEVRKIYRGKITVTEAPGWGYPWRRDAPDFLQDIDLMNFDFNYIGSEVFHPRVSDMARRFREFMRQDHPWMAVPYMKQYGKPWLVNAIYCPNGDGVNRYLHLHGERPDEGPLLLDNQEQVDYMEAGLRALSELAESEVGTLLMGVIMWCLDDWPVPPDQVQYQVAGRPVEQAIRLWFCGQGRLKQVYTPSSTIRRGDTLLQDDFEDSSSTMCAGYWQRFPADWEFVDEDGNRFLRAKSHNWLATSGKDWTDYKVKIRVRLMSEGEALLTLRIQEFTYEAYVLVFGTNGIMLLRNLGGGQVKLLAKANLLETVELGRWYNLEVSLVGNVIRAWVDNRAIFSYIETDQPLLKGGVALDVYNPKGIGQGVNRALVDFDDILIVAE